MRSIDHVRRFDMALHRLRLVAALATREIRAGNGGGKKNGERAQCEIDETETDMGMQWEEQWLPHPGYDAGRAGAPHHDPHGRPLIIRPSPLLSSDRSSPLSRARGGVDSLTE